MKNKIYHPDQHKISSQSIDKDALWIIQKLQEEGFQAYLVGGGVRDLLFGKKPKDFDICTSAKPEQIKKIFKNTILIGRRFRLAHVRFGRKIIEVSTFRAGDNEVDKLIVQDNEWGTPEQDATRRDFTINGLFYDPRENSVIDYVNGYPDIEKCCLRTIGKPFLRFKQDPVRMIRLIKFRARFGLEIERDTEVALMECRHEILNSSQARILEELLRMLEIGSSFSFFSILSDYGFLQLIMPSLSELLESLGKNVIFSYLREIDSIILEKGYLEISRPILISALVFPSLQNILKTHYYDRNITPSFEQLIEESHLILDTFFKPFFVFPKKLRISIVFILAFQLRMSSTNHRYLKKLKVPKSPDFPDALRFLQIRTLVEPELQETYQNWEMAFLSQQKKRESHPRKNYEKEQQR